MVILFDVDPETAIDLAKTGYVSVVEPGENVVFEKVAVAKASQGNLRGVPVTRGNLGVPFGRHIDGRARVCGSSDPARAGRQVRCRGTVKGDLQKSAPKKSPSADDEQTEHGSGDPRYLPVHFPTRVQQMAAEVASVSVEDWPVGDDFLLREAVEAGAALASIARGILPFSRAYTLADVEIRWRCVPVSTPTRPHPGTLATRDPARDVPAARVLHLGDAAGYPPGARDARTRG